MDGIKDILPVIFVQIIVEQITNWFYSKLGFASLVQKFNFANKTLTPYIS